MRGWTAAAFSFSLMFLSSGSAAASAHDPTRPAVQAGDLNGRIVDARSGQPVPGAAIRLVTTEREAVSDDHGDFSIRTVAAGTYELRVEAAGFRAVTLDGVIVRNGEQTAVRVALIPETVRIDEQVEVVGRLPQTSESQPGSAFTLTGTRLTTVSGTMGDFGRTLRTVPAAAGTSDERNTVVARGGNPVENGYFIDNIEVPNTSHFPDWASSGGLYSLIDPSAVGTADFIVGGFPATFGGFLSSITDITYREGSRDTFKAQARFDIAMGSAAAEGPLPGRRGSWRASVRHADFVYLKHLISINDQNPRWTDGHLKVVYDLSSRHTVSLLDVYSSDRLFETRSSGDGERTRIDQNTAGLAWRASWSDRLRSETSASYSAYTRYLGEEYTPPDDAYNWAITRTTEWYAVRNENTWMPAATTTVRFGVQARRYSHNVGYVTVPSRPGTVLVSNGPWQYRTTDAAAFASSAIRPFSLLRTTIGVRVDHSTASGRTHVSPRIAAVFRLARGWELTGAGASVHQALPADFLAFVPGALDLRDMRADQYSVGLGYRGRPGWRATIELYDKRYTALPIDPDRPHRLILDREPFRDYTIPLALVDAGSGRARGVEAMVERQVGSVFSVVIAARASRDRYRDVMGTERDRLFDSRYGLSVAADWTPSPAWSLSSTLVVQDGTPYTPTHVGATVATGIWYHNASRYNGVRYPAYATFNARVERRFALGKAQLAVFGDVWNLLGRKNVGWIEGWNPAEGDVFRYQMPRTPFVGAGVVF